VLRAERNWTQAQLAVELDVVTRDRELRLLVRGRLQPGVNGSGLYWL
jgi:hypothetical protein